MLIQCHACNTKYRLNLEQIPRRKTFVRCKHCGTPIYIDPTEEGLDERSAGVFPAPPGAPPGQPSAETQAAMPQGESMVTCPGCRARYRIPPEMQSKPQAKLKCSQCGILFASPLSATMDAAHFPTASGEDASGRGGVMPLPGEERMEELFDDLRPEETLHHAPDRFQQSPPELGTLDASDFGEDSRDPDPDQAYLEAIAFDEDVSDGASPQRGTVPDDQKYSVFLHPDEFSKGGKDDGMSRSDDLDDASGEIPDQASDLELPPLDDVSLDAPDLKAPEAPTGDSAAPSLEAHPDLPELPALREESAQDAEEANVIFQTREVVPGQPAKVMTEKRVLMLLAAASVCILLGTAAWGFLLATHDGPDGPFAVQIGQSHQLMLEEGLTGRYLVNRPSGQRLFVVTGEIENRFPDADNVHWIRLRGMAYADREQSRPLSQAFSYAGNVLEDSQLTQWELPAIKAYYGFINGRKDLNLEIPSGSRVPYQLVFMDMKEKVERTVAEVVSYRRREQTVFIDTP